MRGKKTGALLVALAVAVLLSSRGEKETGSVLSAYDYGYQAGEADEIALEKPGADIRGICGDVLFFAQEASSSVMRYFAEPLATHLQLPHGGLTRESLCRWEIRTIWPKRKKAFLINMSGILRFSAIIFS